MITYVICDLFTSPARTLVNTVNTVGVMGKGIAKDFKTIYPEMFAKYQQLCEKGLFDIGQLWLYRTPHKWVLNFPTKRHWRSPSHPDYIEAGLAKFANTYHVYGITDVSFPMLGCGNGELDWQSQVRPLMEHYLSKLPIDVHIHLQDQQDTWPEHRNLREIKKWLRGEPESLAFSEVWADLIGAIATDPYITVGTESQDVQVKVGGDEESIVLELAETEVEIPAHAFLDLWQQLRGAGFLSGDYFPGGLNVHSEWIVSLMTKLSYIRPVEMVEKFESAYKRQAGLRIVPSGDGGRKSALLLSGVGVVEPE